MATIKIIEVLAESDKGWEDAVKNAVAEAGKSLHGIKSVWVRNLKAEVKNGVISSWRLNCKISFELDENK